MKNLLSKIFPVLKMTRGKKPVVIILSIVAVALLYYASTKGWISLDSVSVEQIVDGISSAFPSDTIEIPVDSIMLPVDTTALQVIDNTLIK